MTQNANEVALATLIAVASPALLGLCHVLDASLPVVALVGALTVCLAALSPLGSLGAVIIALPWFYRPVEIADNVFPISELLLFSAIAGITANEIVTRMRAAGGHQTQSESARARLSASRAWIYAWALALLGLLHLFWSNGRVDPGAAAREWRWTLLEPAIFITALTITNARRWGTSFIAAALIGATLVSAVAGLFDLVSSGGVVAEGARRIAGPYPHPNALALFLVRGWAVAAAWWVLAPHVRRLLLLPVGIISVALLASLSRGALLAAAVVMVALAVYATPRMRVVTLAVASAAAVAVFALAGARMLDTFSGGSASLRLDIWSSALALIRDQPVWGYGPDGFLYNYTPRYVAPTAWAERFTAHAHNLVLDFWIRLGIIGAAAAVAIIVLCAARYRAVVSGKANPDVVQIAALFGGIAALTHGMVDGAYFVQDLAMSAWLLVWLACTSRATHEVRVEDRRAHTSGRGSRIHRVASLR